MESKKLVFRISADGQAIKVEGMGFVGQECLEKGKLFMDRLGSVDSQVLKPEYDEVPFTEPVAYEEQR